MGKPSRKPGQRVGRLTLLKWQPYTRHEKAKWHCLCDCGAHVTRTSGYFTAPMQVECSCGCAAREKYGSKKQDDGGYCLLARGGKWIRVW